jgi:hypothetical protein
MAAWVPSQKGLFFEAPQRQKRDTVPDFIAEAVRGDDQQSLASAFKLRLQVLRTYA